MNHFVDCLEGLSLTQSKILPRKKFHVDRGRGRKSDRVEAIEEPLDHISSRVDSRDDSEDNSDIDLPASKNVRRPSFSQEVIYLLNSSVTPRQFLFLHSYSGPSDILFLVAMEVHRSFNQSTPSPAGSLL